MAANWMRRTVLVAACASAALLAACGSSTTESAIKPDRFVAFGDANSDVGQNGSLYTINDGSINNWTLQVASGYGTTIKPVSAGGTSYAVGNARVALKPDAAGKTDTPTITEQIDRFLAADKFGANDVVLISGGVSDVIANMAAVNAGTMTEADMVAASRKAGETYAAQIKRLVDAGAKHVVVLGTHNLSRTPWGKAIQRQTLLDNASSRFNDGLLVNIVDMGSNVLYVDLAYYVNVYEGTPAYYNFTNATLPVCTSVDAGNGIGTGTGLINSALCNSGTLLPNVDPQLYVFADGVYLTPHGQRQFGIYAYDRLRARW